MSTALNIAGCKRLANKILEYLNQLLLTAMSNDYNKSKEFAGKIVYDGENLKEFIPDDICPAWLSDAITKCNDYKNLGGIPAAEYAKRAIVIKDILFELQNFKWEDLRITSTGIDLDAEFSKQTAAMELDKAIERLIDCLQIISNDPAFHLKKQTVVDIQSVINGLRGSTHASESAIHSWLITAGELIKLFVPHMDKMEKSFELLRKTEAAYDEAAQIITNARAKIAQKLIAEFCLGDAIVPAALPAPQLQLALPEFSGEQAEVKEEDRNV